MVIVDVDVDVVESAMELVASMSPTAQYRFRSSIADVANRLMNSLKSNRCCCCAMIAIAGWPKCVSMSLLEHQ